MGGGQVVRYPARRFLPDGIGLEIRGPPSPLRDRAAAHGNSPEIRFFA
jgi:hypothetical protein